MQRSTAGLTTQLPSSARGFLWRWLSGFRLILVWFSVVAGLSSFLSSEGKDCCAPCLETGRHQGDIEGFPYGFGSPVSCFRLRDACANSGSFCFPSAPVGFLAHEDGSQEPSSDAVQESSQTGGISFKRHSSSLKSFEISGGGVVTCSSLDTVTLDTVSGADDQLYSNEKNIGEYDVALCQPPIVPDSWMKTSGRITSDSDYNPQDVLSVKADGPSSLAVDIRPPLLDWGSSRLYSASMALVTVTNMKNDTVLQVYEPFSTDSQFYAYNYENLSLASGENTSITFIFLPRSLGPSSAHLVLQTNFGGFIIQAKGIAVGSPYQIEPLLGMEISADDVLNRNLSIYNPFGDALYVEGVAAWISTSDLANQSTHVVCQLDAFPQISEPHVRRNEYELPGLDMRPHEQWEVPPQKSNTIIELDLWPRSGGVVFGAVCVRLRNRTTGGTDLIVVPLELQVHAKAACIDSSGSVSVSFECLLACDERESIFSISLRNEASQLLKLLSITEDTTSPKVFQIKYIEGLLLFAGSVTEIALIMIPAQPSPAIDSSCNIVIETNNSVSPSAVISCLDLVHSCSNRANSGVPDSEGSYVGLVSHEENKESANARTGSLENLLEESLAKPKHFRTSEADDLILRNWQSHRTTPAMSVLEDEKLLFPVVEIGFQYSKWITVHNPSPNLAVMQLVLSSRVNIDQCKSVNDISDHTFSSRSPAIDSIETRFGFSIADSGITEACVHPYGSASLGPVVFRPSGRFVWLSSALIRNNVSGGEWLPLRASGGSHSIVLLEGSETVWRLEFNFELLGIHNMSSPPLMKPACPSCTQLLLKEIYAKNTGELPLEVKKVKVSGIDCSLDGFTINDCNGFAMAPGESVRLLISYRPDFSSAIVQRDLELSMATGIFVIPMKASIPVCMVNLCTRSFLRSVHWKVSVLLLAVASIMLVFIRITPHTAEFYVKLDDGGATISKADKPSSLQNSNKTPRPVRGFKKPEGTSIDRYTIGRSDVLDSDHQRKGVFLPPPLTVEPVVDTGLMETPPGGNLTIRIVKEKGRRKKRKAGGAVLAMKFEVSSSNSGNSTPSSPASPSDSTPEKHEKKHLAEITERPVAAALVTVDRPHVLPSDSRQDLVRNWREPDTPQSFLFSSSPIAPHARAPGSNLRSNKIVKQDQKEMHGNQNKFTYDIWGDHFGGDILGEMKERSAMAFDSSEGDSRSFFAREPRSLVTMRSARPGSPPGNELSHDDVTCFYQMN